MNSNATSSWTTTTPTTHEQATTIASWSTTAPDAAAWVSGPEPVSTETVLGWWQRPDVTAVLLHDSHGNPVAYGEVWDDQEENEGELARLIVDPTRRRQGTGRRLVEVLLDIARQHARTQCFLRVVPDNTVARALYRSTGFTEVDQASMADWNSGQPTSYVWMQHPSASPTGDAQRLRPELPGALT